MPDGEPCGLAPWRERYYHITDGGPGWARDEALRGRWGRVTFYRDARDTRRGGMIRT